MHSNFKNFQLKQCTLESKEAIALFLVRRNTSHVLREPKGSLQLAAWAPAPSSGSRRMWSSQPSLDKGKGRECASLNS